MSRAWVVAMFGLAACASPPTGVQLAVVYDDAWALTALSVDIGDRSVPFELARDLTLVVPEDWAGTEHKLEVWGLVATEKRAYGEITMSLRAGELQSATVVLRPVDCVSPCTAGDMRCEADGVATCLAVDGCGVWTTPAPCPADTPYCSNGTCNATCDDECTACPDPQWVWTRPAVTTAPSARDGFAMVFDAARGEVVLFGGGRGPGTNRTYFDDTWTWSGTAWTNVTPSTRPPARDGHAMAYDAATQSVILFGGGVDFGTGRSYFDDTWRWNGTSWAQVTVTSPPAGRDYHTLAYDAVREQVVMFGGGAGFGTQRGYTNETYLWDGGAWVSQSPAASPPDRDEHAMAWDSTRQAIVVVGGGTGSFTHRESLDDVWLWNGATWAAAPAGPGARDGTALAVDGLQHTLALFGGAIDGGTWLDDAWAWRANTWQEVSTAMRPSPRDNHEMVYDPLRASIVLFGGGSGLLAQRTYSGETWLLRSECNSARRD